MSLVKSREMFVESAYPIFVDTVGDRTLIQNDLHRHEYFEMLFVEKGSLVNRFKGEELLLKSGDILIMKPYVLHVLLDAVKNQSRKAYCCSFLPQAVDLNIQSLEEVAQSSSGSKYFFKSFLSLVEDGASAVHLKSDELQVQKLAALMAELQSHSHDFSERGQALARCSFLGLLAYMAEQFEPAQVTNYNVGADVGASTSRYQAGLRVTLNYLHDHFKEPLKLQDMAAMSGASETYFCRMFKHETGMTFLNYINSLRIDQACILLRETTDNASDICYQIGFNDYTHFGRQFKKHTGMSPVDYRKHKQDNDS